MTNERIAEIKALCEAAPQGDWFFRNTEADAEFIAAARQIIPELLEALEDTDTWLANTKGRLQRMTESRDGWRRIAENFERHFKEAHE